MTVLIVLSILSIFGWQIYRCCSYCRIIPCSSGYNNIAVLDAALPDSYSFSLHSILSAERAQIFGVLCDFHLFDGFTEGCTITGAIFTDDSDLLCSLGHSVYFNSQQEKKAPC